MLTVTPHNSPSYPIRIVDGGVEGLGPALAQTLPPGPAVVVTNPVVGALYRRDAVSSLRKAGFSVDVLEIPDGEVYKTLDTWRALVEDLLAVGVNRRTPVIALGGGVTGDVAGFAAATVMRGAPLVQVPTSLLAMVDSAVGGKTGVNTPAGKNLVGAFYQPRLVFIGLAVLKTLPVEELRSGLGEVIKHGLIGDVELFARCQEQPQAILALQGELMRRLVEGCCRVKAQVVAEDVLERGRRVVLNLGHTVGHAVEAAAGFGTLRHGECVGLGLIAEARWAAQRGSCPPAVPGQIVAVMAGLGMQTQAPPLEMTALLSAAKADKKLSRDTLSTAVLDDIGRLHVESVPVEEISAMMTQLFPSEKC